jgi:hypothetical protein
MTDAPAGWYPDPEDSQSQRPLTVRKGFRFVASTNIKNTGNIGIKDRATAKWYQIGGAPVTREKVVKVEVGEHKNVRWTVLANSDQIDKIQALPYNKQCSVKVSIFDTYGQSVAK